MNWLSMRVVGWVIVVLLVLVSAGAMSGFLSMAFAGSSLIGPAVFWALGFVALQAFIFRALGLRSQADAPDEDADDTPAAGRSADDQDDRDWRAWRG